MILTICLDRLGTGGQVSQRGRNQLLTWEGAESLLRVAGSGPKN